ncbi:hypothetical protein C6341_g6225 [Phytophthora cactorum]|nr:hypothetical protein C6341_g6225 [Phytophthora cactorum]
MPFEASSSSGILIISAPLDESSLPLLVPLTTLGSLLFIKLSPYQMDTPSPTSGETYLQFPKRAPHA